MGAGHNAFFWHSARLPLLKLPAEAIPHLRTVRMFHGDGPSSSMFAAFR